MKATSFNFNKATFWFSGIDAATTLEVHFIPIGGTNYGYLVNMDGKEIARGLHHGRFTSGDAAEYALQAVTAKIKAVDGDFGGMRVIGGATAKGPENS